MKKTNKTQLAAMGTVVLSGLAANVSADANPFAMTELSGGYMQVAADTHNKVTEAGCGASAKADAQAKAGHDEHAGHVKKAEGSCGAGQCGAMMKDGKMKPGMESTCGAMMKGHDGACGMSGMSDMKHDDAGKSGQMACGAMMKDSETSCGAKMHGGH